MMKRILCALFASLLLFTCCTGCESKEEKARREIREATEAYEQAKADVNATKAELEYIQSLIDLHK